MNTSIATTSLVTEKPKVALLWKESEGKQILPILFEAGYLSAINSIVNAESLDVYSRICDENNNFISLYHQDPNNYYAKVKHAYEDVKKNPILNHDNVLSFFKDFVQKYNYIHKQSAHIKISTSGSVVTDTCIDTSDIDIILTHINNETITKSKPVEVALRNYIQEFNRNRPKSERIFTKFATSGPRGTLLKSQWREGRFVRNIDINMPLFLDAELKSCILNSYLFIIPSAKTLVRMVKYWASIHNIKDSECGDINSYSLSLYVILFLQHRFPDLFPPLAQIIQSGFTILENRQHNIKNTHKNDDSIDQTPIYQHPIQHNFDESDNVLDECKTDDTDLKTMNHSLNNLTLPPFLTQLPYPEIRNFSQVEQAMKMKTSTSIFENDSSIQFCNISTAYSASNSEFSSDEMRKIAKDYKGILYAGKRIDENTRMNFGIVDIASYYYALLSKITNLTKDQFDDSTQRLRMSIIDNGADNVSGEDVADKDVSDEDVSDEDIADEDVGDEDVSDDILIKMHPSIDTNNNINDDNKDDNNSNNSKYKKKTKATHEKKHNIMNSDVDVDLFLRAIQLGFQNHSQIHTTKPDISIIELFCEFMIFFANIFNPSQFVGSITFGCFLPLSYVNHIRKLNHLPELRWCLMDPVNIFDNTLRTFQTHTKVFRLAAHLHRAKMVIKSQASPHLLFQAINTSSFPPLPRRYLPKNTAGDKKNRDNLRLNNIFLSMFPDIFLTDIDKLSNTKGKNTKAEKCDNLVHHLAQIHTFACWNSIVYLESCKNIRNFFQMKKNTTEPNNIISGIVFKSGSKIKNENSTLSLNILAADAYFTKYRLNLHCHKTELKMLSTLDKSIPLVNRTNSETCTLLYELSNSKHIYTLIKKYIKRHDFMDLFVNWDNNAIISFISYYQKPTNQKL